MLDKCESTFRTPRRKFNTRRLHEPFEVIATQILRKRHVADIDSTELGIQILYCAVQLQRSRSEPSDKSNEPNLSEQAAVDGITQDVSSDVTLRRTRAVLCSAELKFIVRSAALLRLSPELSPLQIKKTTLPSLLSSLPFIATSTPELSLLCSAPPCSLIVRETLANLSKRYRW